tara:strand:- start:3064 stop:3252 length:189 start_codon:yes stop_codon:yes gene_type:complete
MRTRAVLTAPNPQDRHLDAPRIGIPFEDVDRTGICFRIVVLMKHLLQQLSESQRPYLKPVER